MRTMLPPTIAVVKASIPEDTDTENLLPRDASDVHPFLYTPRAPFPAHRSASLLCSREVWVTQSVVCCRQRIPRPTIANPRLHLGVAIYPVYNRFIAPFDLQCRFLAKYQCSKVEGRQIPWFLCRHRSFGLLINWLLR